jgi:hypothetical protein
MKSRRQRAHADRSTHPGVSDTRGYTILEGALPASLIADLRREAAVGVELARERHGSQFQVVQPITSYLEMDDRPFRDYAEHPGLNEAVQSLLTPEHRFGDLNYFD